MVVSLFAALTLLGSAQEQPVATTPAAPQPAATQPVESAPVETAPVETAPVQNGPVQNGPVENGPVATSNAESAPASPTAASGSQVDNPDYLPVGAPSDDYGFVAWCDGVLAGHMDIGEKVKDVLPLDSMQQKIGKAYLRAYVKALDEAPESKTDEGLKRAEAARKDGWSRWDQARAADHKLAADTYLAYQLPGRCEHAAIRLSHDPELFHLAPSVAEVSALTPSVGADAEHLTKGDAPPKPPSKSKRKKGRS